MKNLVEDYCKTFHIKFTRTPDEKLDDFSKKLNENIPDLYTSTAIKFILYCDGADIKISEVHLCNGGYQFFFDGLKGDAIIHKFSYSADQGMMETMNFDFDQGDVTTHKPFDLAVLIREEMRGISDF